MSTGCDCCFPRDDLTWIPYGNHLWVKVSDYEALRAMLAIAQDALVYIALDDPNAPRPRTIAHDALTQMSVAEAAANPPLNRGGESVPSE